MSKYPDIIKIDLDFMQSVVLVFNRASQTYGRAILNNDPKFDPFIKSVKNSFYKLGVTPKVSEMAGHQIIRFRSEDNERLIELANKP